jgi:hypothetical protein
VTATSILPGATCTAGGEQIQTGIDRNGNGTLEASEVQQTSYVCNASDETAAINAETARATSAETSLQSSLNQEISDRKSSVSDALERANMYTDTAIQAERNLTTSSIASAMQSTVRLTTAVSPPCVAGTAGTLWYAAGGTSVKDTVSICAKDGTDTYAWRVLF